MILSGPGRFLAWLVGASGAQPVYMYIIRPRKYVTNYLASLVAAHPGQEGGEGKPQDFKEPSRRDAAPRTTRLSL